MSSEWIVSLYKIQRGIHVYDYIQTNYWRENVPTENTWTSSIGIITTLHSVFQNTAHLWKSSPPSTVDIYINHNATLKSAIQ